MSEMMQHEPVGCTCQGCGCRFTVDVLVPDEVWEKIKPEGKPEGAGLLCGACIMERIEQASGYDAWRLVRVESVAQSTQREMLA